MLFPSSGMLFHPVSGKSYSHVKTLGGNGWEERGLSRGWGTEERTCPVSPERGPHDPLQPPRPCGNVGPYSQIFPFFSRKPEKDTLCEISWYFKCWQPSHIKKKKKKTSRAKSNKPLAWVWPVGGGVAGSAPTGLMGAVASEGDKVLEDSSPWCLTPSSLWQSGEAPAHS